MFCANIDLQTVPFSSPIQRLDVWGSHMEGMLSIKVRISLNSGDLFDRHFSRSATHSKQETQASVDFSLPARFAERRA